VWPKASLGQVSLRPLGGQWVAVWGLPGWPVRGGAKASRLWPPLCGQWAVWHPFALWEAGPFSGQRGRRWPVGSLLGGRWPVGCGSRSGAAPKGVPRSRCGVASGQWEAGEGVAPPIP
jgi:hypothetical protein